MNPCVCGFLTDPQKECICTPIQIQRYRSRVSGPLLDRIDIQIEVPGLRYQELASKDAGKVPTSFVLASTKRGKFSCKDSTRIKYMRMRRWAPKKSNATAR